MRKIFTLFLMLAVVCISKANNATFSWKINGGGATGADRSADVVTDPSGNIFTANYFLNEATFNGVTHTGVAKGSGANYDNSLFVSKIDSTTKATLWSLYSNDGVVTPTGMATTSAGDLIVVGTIRAVVNTAGQTATANIIDAAETATSFSGLGSATSTVQGFVAKFNASGIVQWVKEINSDATKATAITPSSVAVDGDDNVYVSGTFVGSVLFPDASTALTTTNTSKAAYIVKLSGSDGSSLWNLTSSGGISSEDINALACGSDGYLYAAGIFTGVSSTAVTIGDQSFTPSTGYDLVLLKVSATGSVQYIQDRTNGSRTTVKDLIVNGTTAYVGGSFYGNGTGLVFTNAALTTTAAYYNGYIAAFSTTDGSDVWQKAVAAPAIAEVSGLAMGSDNYLYAFGYHYNALGTSVASAAVDFGSGITLADTSTPNKMGDLFLAGYNATSGTTTEVHLVASGTSAETSNAFASSGNKLYFVGSSNSNPMTFENDSTYSTTGSFDFFVGAYTVPVETTGIDVETSTATTITYDKADKSIAVSGAETLSHITVFTVAGSVAYSASLSSTSASVQVDLDRGLYLVQVSNANGNVTVQKILIP